MELPSIISKDFAPLREAETDLELYDLLLNNTDDLVRFFVFAAEDETWSDNHEEFMRKALLWFTHQFFLGKLDDGFAKEVADTFYDHYAVLHAFLPRNLQVKIQSKMIPANSLLLGTQSAYLNNLIIRQCRDKNKRILPLPTVDEKYATFITDYLERRHLKDLWKQEKKEIIELLEMANKLHLEPLAEECQNILKRYITQDNVLDTLVMAHQKHWQILKEAAVIAFNRLDRGIILQAIDQDHLGLEFLFFSDQTWETFTKLKLWVTHLIFSKNLSMDERFAVAVRECPKLVSLDLSNSENRSPYLQQVPDRVKELIVARCIWLNNATLKIIAPFFPQIYKLDVTQNTDITYVGWGELKKFPELKSLQIAHCYQISDADLTLILQSCLGLREIDVTNCRNITVKGFLELAQTLSKLTILKARRTAINDAVLVELANRAHFIEFADFSHCLDITEKGLTYFLKYEGSLKVLNLESTRFSEEALQSFQKLFPKIEMIF